MNLHSCSRALALVLTVVLPLSSVALASGNETLVRALQHTRGWQLPGAGAVPGSGLSASVVAKKKKLRHLDVAAKDIAYGPGSRMVYVTVGSDSPRYPGTLLVINPAKGKVVQVIPLGGDSSKMALSDAERTAYVVVDRTIVKRVDLSSHQVVAEFTPLLPDIDEPIRPSALAVMPGHPDTVAVSFEFSEHTGDAGTALYDDGVRRPLSIARFTCRQMIFSGDVLWTNPAYPDVGLATLRSFEVRPDGLADDGRHPIFEGSYDVSLVDGRFYVTTGEIIDESLRRRVAWIPTGDFRFVAAHAVSRERDLIYYAFNYESTVIYAFDRNTQRAVAAFDGSPFRQRTWISRMVDCGEAGLTTLDDLGVTFFPTRHFRELRPYERPVPVGENGQVRSVALPNNAIVYDDVRRKMYATVGPGVAGIGNGIVEVDPFAGSVGRDLLVGSVPAVMEMSPDRRDLYVAMWGSYQFKRLSLPDLATVQSVDLDRGPYDGDDTPHPTNAQELLPLRASPGSVVVLYNYQPWYLEQPSEGLAVYDGADRRPGRTGTYEIKPSSVELSASGSEVYGLNSLNTGFEFLKYQVHAGGVYQAQNCGSVAGAFFDQIHCPTATCYANSGLVIDATTCTRAGVLPVERGPFTTVLVATDVERGVVYQMVASDDGFEITKYDATSFARISSFNVPPYLSYYVADLLVWDDGRQLAFSTGDRIYFVPVALLRP